MARQRVSRMQQMITAVTGIGAAGARRRESNKIMAQMQESTAASAR